MGYEANSRVRAGAGSRRLARLRESEAIRTALRVFTWSRGLVLLVAIFAALNFGPAAGGQSARNAATFDDPALTHSVGGAGDVLLAPLARWDAVWYLEIASSGYGAERHRAAFFPLYPLLVAAVGVAGGGSAAAALGGFLPGGRGGRRLAGRAAGGLLPGGAGRVPRRARAALPPGRARAGPSRGDADAA